jgi:hypothetical protein
MIRKLVVIFAAITALTTVTAKGALAAHGGLGMHAGHSGMMRQGFVAHNFAPHHSQFRRDFEFRHDRFFHDRFAFRHHHRFFHNRFAFVSSGFAFDDECFVVRRVRSPWGRHWRRIWVCD